MSLSVSSLATVTFFFFSKRGASTGGEKPAPFPWWLEICQKCGWAALLRCTFTNKRK